MAQQTLDMFRALHPDNMTMQQLDTAIKMFLQYSKQFKSTPEGPGGLRPVQSEARCTPEGRSRPLPPLRRDHVKLHDNEVWTVYVMATAWPAAVHKFRAHCRAQRACGRLLYPHCRALRACPALHGRTMCLPCTRRSCLFCLLRFEARDVRGSRCFFFFFSADPLWLRVLLFYTTTARETQNMFETFNVPAIPVTIEAVLSLSASRRTTALRDGLLRHFVAHSSHQ